MACSMRKRIDVSPAFVAFLCAYYYFDPLHTFSPFLLSGILHEMGHLITLRLYKVEIHSIKLRMSGAEIASAPMSYFQEILVAISGPLVNLMLLFFSSKTNPNLAFMNFVLVAYNLLPIYPLDGGRILHAMLHIMLPSVAAEILEHVIGLLCISGILAASCYLTCVWHAGLWPVILSGILFFRVSEMILKEKRKITL
ncbi:MAG: hypothetical protein E7434_04555 [Ruminococcaceae bacterium]|nr:hypothetical protein [Oscillospiraceae bacterium]